MSSRRELLRLLGIAPVAAKAAMGEFVALASSPAIKAMAAAQWAGSLDCAAMPHSQSIFGAILGKRLDYLREVAEEQESRRTSLREVGIEPDIAALKSISRAFKVAKQLDRDFSFIRTSVRARRTLWGDMTGIDD